MKNKDQLPSNTSDTGVTARSTSFGIGCFHFGIRVSEPRQLSFAGYAAELVTALESVDTITGVRVDSVQELEWDDEIELNEQPDSLEQGATFPRCEASSARLPYTYQSAYRRRCSVQRRSL